MNFPIIPLSVTFGWRSKDEPKAALASAAAQPLVAIDRDFLLTLAIFIMLYGVVVTLSGMALASAARR